MALSGALLADFSSFQKACVDAETQLKAMELGAGKTGAALNDMVIKFSGGTAINEALMISEAVSRVGGVAALTAKEMALVNLQLGEAIDKFKTLGVEAPESLKKLHAETTKIPAATDGILQKLGPLASAFGVAFSVGAVVGFTRELINDADALTKLTDKTGIAIEPMQRLRFAAEQSGNTFEQVAGAVTSMQQRIAGGNNDAVGALTQLGISLADFKAMAPDEQFIAVAREVAKIEDPMTRAAMATAVFGRAGAEVLPTLIADVTELGNQAPVMSDKAVKAFDAVGDAVSRSWTAIKGATGEGLGAAIDGYSRLLDIGTLLATGDFTKAALVLADLKTEIIEVKPPTDAFSTATDKLGLSWDEARESGKEITRVVEGQIANAKKMAELENDWEKALAKRTIAEKEAARLEAAALLTTTKLWNEYFLLRESHGATTNEVQIAQIKKWEADTIASAIKAGTATKEFYTALAATSAEKMAAVGNDFDKAFREKSIPALQELADNAKRTYDQMVASGQFHRDELAKQLALWHELRDAARGFGDSAVDAHGRAAAAAAAAAAAQAILDAARQKALERELQLKSRLLPTAFDVTSQNFQQTMEGLITSFGQNPSGAGSPYNLSEAIAFARLGYSFQEILAIFHRRASGATGPIPPPQGPRIPGFAGGVENFGGGLAVVGERGPELVNLPAGSSVLANGRGMGTTVYHVTVHAAAVGSEQQLARMVQQALIDLERAQGKRAGN